MAEMGGQESLLGHPIPAVACSVKGTPLRTGEVALSLQLSGHGQLLEGGVGQAGVTQQGGALKPELSKVLWVQTPSTASCLLRAEGAYCLFNAGNH